MPINLFWPPCLQGSVADGAHQTPHRHNLKSSIYHTVVSRLVIAAYKKSVPRFRSEEETACFTSASCKSLAIQVLLDGSKYTWISGPPTAHRTCRRPTAYGPPFLQSKSSAQSFLHAQPPSSSTARRCMSASQGRTTPRDETSTLDVHESFHIFKLFCVIIIWKCLVTSFDISVLSFLKLSLSLSFI